MPVGLEDRRRRARRFFDEHPLADPMEVPREVTHGTCALLGGSGSPCQDAPCIRERLGVDEWTDPVFEAIELYFRVSRWRAPAAALRTPASTQAFARMDLRLAVAALDDDDARRDLLHRCSILHDQLMEIAEAKAESD